MSTSVDIQRPQGSTITVNYDVVVVGAGPYGLSTAAHLLGRGLNVVVLGKPLQLWRDNMPKGMFLRSFWWASNLSDPQKKYGLAQYFQVHHQEEPQLLSREAFVDYGLWFQKQVVPNVDETYVATIRQSGDRFELVLEDGRVLRSRVVIMAPGLYYYTYRPEQYNHLPANIISHTVDDNSYDRFIGKQVIVLGGGQSALEAAALLNEIGAQATVVSRSPLHWLKDDPWEEERSLYQRIRYPKAGISPGWFNWGLEKFPYLFQQLPRSTKDRFLRGRGRYGPAGSAWLRPRLLGRVPMHEEVSVKKVKEAKGKIMMTLSNCESLQADHLMLATGYRVDVKRLPMLAGDLVSKIQVYQNAPVLNQSFESTVPGLYFVGISSMLSFGPLYRFVVGTDAAAHRVADAVSQVVASKK